MSRHHQPPLPPIDRDPVSRARDVAQCPTCGAHLCFRTDGNGHVIEWCPERAKHGTPAAARVIAPVREAPPIPPGAHNSYRRRASAVCKAKVLTCACGASIPYAGNGRPRRFCDQCEAPERKQMRAYEQDRRTRDRALCRRCKKNPVEGRVLVCDACVTPLTLYQRKYRKGGRAA